MEKLQDEMELLLDPEAIGENLDAQSEKFAELIGSNQSYLNALDADMAKMQASMTSKFGKYITFAEDGTIRLTEAYYNASGDIVEEMDAWIEEYDDLIGRTDDLEGAIRDLKKEAVDFFNDARDAAIDLTDELAEILKERDEKALEEKEKYYEELEKKDDKYLEAIRENIEAERKARDRANSYEDLGKK
jgi:DNA repair exonuclease SbcCD ATPase subunit